jgi:hypothetical protein
VFAAPLFFYEDKKHTTPYTLSVPNPPRAQCPPPHYTTPTDGGNAMPWSLRRPLRPHLASSTVPSARRSMSARTPPVARRVYRPRHPRAYFTPPQALTKVIVVARNSFCTYARTYCVSNSEWTKLVPCDARWLPIKSDKWPLWHRRRRRRTSTTPSQTRAVAKPTKRSRTAAHRALRTPDPAFSLRPTYSRFSLRPTYSRRWWGLRRAWYRR